MYFVIAVLWIWIQHFKWIWIRIQGFDDQKLKATENFVIFFDQKLQFTYPYASIKDPSYRKSLKPSKENIQPSYRWNLLTVFYFSGSFLPSWIRIQIANQEPDPGTPLNLDQIRIHSTGDISVPDPIQVTLYDDKPNAGSFLFYNLLARYVMLYNKKCRL